MPDTRATFDHLPILRELGDDLHAAFDRDERRATALVAARRRRRWVLPAGGLAAAAAVAGVLAFTSGLDSGHVAPAPATAAAQALRRAATVAEDRPAPFPRDDQFFYVRSRATNL